MKGILQIFTGGWKQNNYQPEEIISKIEEIEKYFPMDTVIIGWSMEKECYQKVGTFLKGKNIFMLLWIPVFSETEELGQAKQIVDLWGNTIKNYELQEGEKFSFFCPTNPSNKRIIWENYVNYFDECEFDGIFLDKIRTQSFIGGARSVLSCGCRDCVKQLEKQGVDIEKFKKLIEKEGLEKAFDVNSFSHENGYQFIHSQTNRFFRAKGKVFAEEVNEIISLFKEKGKIVGLDVFVPFLTPFVGQDLEELSKKADFIKPMMYRKTEAPAGIPFEYHLLKNSLKNSKGYADFDFDTEFLKQEIKAIQKKSTCKVYPGIEINYREDIARTNPEYLRESLQVLKDCNVEGCVLSWNVMQAPKEHISCIADFFDRGQE